MTKLLDYINTHISSVFLPVAIITVGVFFIIYLRGFAFIHPMRTAKLMLTGSAGRRGSMSPLKVLSVSLAGTIGAGNIVGVAVAIIYGGAGAVFWMWMSAFASMLLKYAEITLGMCYRSEKGNTVLGGPMEYMKHGVGGRFGGILAAFYAVAGVFSSFTLGNIVQNNAAALSLEGVFMLPRWVFGLILAAVSALIIFGGFRRIAAFTSASIPIMCLAYIALSCVLIMKNITLVPGIFKDIITEAFGRRQAVGGVGGFSLAVALKQGMTKGVFSHEAGSGTAALSHAQAQTDYPARQGLWGIFEVFADTIVISSFTAFSVLISFDSIIISGCRDGIGVIMLAFSRFFGNYSDLLICVAIVFFAFSTVICWSFYGTRCIGYFTQSKAVRYIYLIIYCGTVAIGAVMQQQLIWELADLSVALMTGINLIAVFILRKQVRRETLRLFEDTKKTSGWAGLNPRPAGSRK